MYKFNYSPSPKCIDIGIGIGMNKTTIKGNPETFSASKPKSQIPNQTNRPKSQIPRY